MPTFISNDAEINYQTFGDVSKPALVFSNSLGTKYSMWQPQIDALQDDPDELSSSLGLVDKGLRWLQAGAASTAAAGPPEASPHEMKP